jgi:hypothetical protein
MNRATENEIERRRLSTITARLTAEDFLRPLQNGWTIATKLAHLAFWDMHYLKCIEGWERQGFDPAPSQRVIATKRD